MSEWKETTLGKVAEVQTGPFGSQLHQRDYVDIGTPIITVEHLVNDKIEHEPDIPKVSDEDRERLIKYTLKEGDIVFSRVGAVDRCGYVSEKEEGWMFSGRLLRVRPDKKIIDPKFLYFFITQNSVKDFIRKIAVGTTMPSLNTALLSQMPVIAPSLDEQRRIAAVLSTLDAKIDLLRRQNHTLERIAQTLFNRWFVEFEFPDGEGRPYKSSGGPMVESELGEIPQGWQVGTLGEITKNIRVNIKSEDILSDTPYIGLEHMPRRKMALDTWGFAEDIESNKFQFKKGHILFGKLRPYFHKVGVAFTDGICSTDILVLSPKKHIFFGFVLMTVSSLEFVKYVSSASEGTRMPRTSWQYMSEHTAAIPDQDISKRFSDLIISFVSKIEVNINQIRTLTRLRDTLLPKLMSGQLRVAA